MIHKRCRVAIAVNCNLGKMIEASAIEYAAELAVYNSQFPVSSNLYQ